MQNKKIILLNGPPGSGKDTIANALKQEFGGKSKVEKFAKPLKEIAQFIYDVPSKLWDELDGSQEKKAEPHEIFFGETCRQIQINISELYMKPTHGKYIFGKLLARRVKNCLHANVFFISDSGFEEEAEAMIDIFGKENVALIRLYRQECSFEGDSRSYIDLTRLGVNHYELLNNGTVKEAVHQVKAHLSKEGLI